MGIALYAWMMEELSEILTNHLNPDSPLQMCMNGFPEKVTNALNHCIYVCNLPDFSLICTNTQEIYRMNKLLIAVFLFALLPGLSISQALKPVKWTCSIEDRKGEEATLVMKASIDKGWHIYSQFTPDGGPLPTVFTFDKNDCYTLIDKVTEPKAHEEYDSTFQIKVLTLDGNPVFKQKIKLNKEECKISGRVEGQVCKEVCVMFDGTLTFEIPKVYPGKLKY